MGKSGLQSLLFSAFYVGDFLAQCRGFPKHPLALQRANLGPLLPGCFTGLSPRQWSPAGARGGCWTEASVGFVVESCPQRMPLPLLRGCGWGALWRSRHASSGWMERAPQAQPGRGGDTWVWDSRHMSLTLRKHSCVITIRFLI